MEGNSRYTALQTRRRSSGWLFLILGLLSLAAPLAIYRLMGYLVDTYPDETWRKYGLFPMLIPTVPSLLMGPVVWMFARSALRNGPAPVTDPSAHSRIRTGMYCAMSATVLWTIVLLGIGTQFLRLMFGGMKA
jgi:hypothetical protein